MKQANSSNSGVVVIGVILLICILPSLAAAQNLLSNPAFTGKTPLVPEGWAAAAGRTPKAGLVAAHTTMRNLGNKRFTGHVPMPDADAHAYLFTGDKEQVIFVRAPPGKDERQGYALKVPGADVRIMDPMGVSLESENPKEPIIHASEEPQFIIIPSPTANLTFTAVDGR